MSTYPRRHTPETPGPTAQVPLYPRHEHQPGHTTPSPSHPKSCQILSAVSCHLSPVLASFLPLFLELLTCLPSPTSRAQTAPWHSHHGLPGPWSIGLAKSGAAVQTWGFPGAPWNLWKGPGPRFKPGARVASTQKAKPNQPPLLSRGSAEAQSWAQLPYMETESTQDIKAKGQAG